MHIVTDHMWLLVQKTFTQLKRLLDNIMALLWKEKTTQSFNPFKQKNKKI